MTANETKLIVSNFENVNKRLDVIDSRVAEFIENSIKIQSVQEQVRSHDIELGRIRESLTRVYTNIDEVLESIRKIEVGPAKNTHAAIRDVKHRFVTALCGVLAAGLIGAVVKIIALLIQN